MIDFTCVCGEALQAADDHAGRRTRCPACGREQPIPAAADAVQRDAPADLGRARSTDVQADVGRPGRGPELDLEAPSRTSGKAIAALVLGVVSLGCNFFTAIPAVVLGILALRDIGRSQGRLGGKPLAVLGLVASAAGCLCVGPVVLGVFGYPTYRGVQSVYLARDRIKSQNNLKQLGLAMQAHHDNYGYFPPAGGPLPGSPFPPGQTGKNNLSWRVHLLPYLGEKALFDRFDPSEPWDGPNNSRLLTQMPKVYELPGDSKAPPGHTYYQVIVTRKFTGMESMFVDDPNARIRFQDITDGTSNTLMIVEGATSVPWTKPDDIVYDPNGPLPPLGKHFRGGCNAVLADGSVRYLSGDLSSATLRALITRNAGDVVGGDF